MRLETHRVTNYCVKYLVLSTQILKFLILAIQYAKIHCLPSLSGLPHRASYRKKIHIFLWNICDSYFHVVFKIPLTFTSSTTQSRVYILKYTLVFFWGHPVSCTIYSYLFHLLLAITHSYVDQIICPFPFFKTKGQEESSQTIRVCSRCL